MTSNMLNSLGLGNMDIGIVLLILILLIIVLFIMLFSTMSKLTQLRKRYEGFMRGRSARSMEEEIRNLFYDIDYLKEESENCSKEIRHIYKRLETVFQRIGLVKYDAFHQMGGKLSFALALLDENNNGFLLNSVQAQDGSYCYSKEIKDGKCALDLSAEEQKALTMALEQEFLRPKKKVKNPEEGKGGQPPRQRKRKEAVRVTGTQVRMENIGRDDDEEKLIDRSIYDTGNIHLEDGLNPELDGHEPLDSIVARPKPKAVFTEETDEWDN